jgi:hypothetical protein
MAAIEAIAFAFAAGFAVIIVATVLVIIGIRQEERRHSFGRDDPPTAIALLARRVLGAHVSLLPRAQPERDEPEDGSQDDPPWYQRRVGPRAG